MTSLDPSSVRAGGPAASDRSRHRNLLLRLASAAVLAPVTLAAAYAGGQLFFVLFAAAAVGILWEWTRLVSGRTDARVMLPGLVALLLAWVMTSLGAGGAAAAAVAIGAAAAGGTVAILPARAVSPDRPVWAAFGVIYAGVAFLGPALLRRDAEWGFVAMLFLAATVWITDIFAYFVGRAVGGARLWPQVSPNKTWAGGIGGSVGGVVAGIAVAYASGLSQLAIIGVIALLLSLLAQAGDLFESAVKRRFGAKDSSRLIPGHGGLMDRLDGFLVAALAALVIGMLRQGMDAPAQGLLVW